MQYVLLSIGVRGYLHAAFPSAPVSHVVFAKDARHLSQGVAGCSMGVYLVLFGICVYIFRGRRKQSHNIFLVVTAFIMFALSTAHIIMIFLSTFHAVLNPDKGLAPENFALAAGHIYITNNIVADGIITKKHLGKQFAERYNMAFQVVVESGLIYSISLIIFLVVYNNGPGSDGGPSRVYPAKTQPITTFPYFFPASYILYVALAQIMGIVSTLIIVRVGLGVSAGDHGETMGTSGTSRSTGPHIRPPRVPPVVSVELSTIVISSGPTPMDRRHSVEQKHPESIDDVSSST
ncbi:hypothetical protein EYR38_005211 [Pleurotus pulmonarius]|nr:hypothetical protein EYR38_005211 [Pleurotus pulmonarius]